jgi:hypothetical protein
VELQKDACRRLAVQIVLLLLESTGFASERENILFHQRTGLHDACGAQPRV